MKKKVDIYKFTGDWEFNLKLPMFSKIYSDHWFRHRRNDDFLNLLQEGYVPFQIAAERNYDPDPTQSQTNAINYLIVNENRIVRSLYEIFTRTINPKHVEWCGEDEWIPELNSESDLGNLARINSIQIIPEKKNDISYTRIDFEYLGDGEHGLAMILHKEKLIGFSGIGDMGYECIYQDLGLDESKVFETLLEQRHIGEDEVHLPILKYGKFKPWQLDATGDYFSKLFRSKENDIIKDEIESKKWDINLKFSELGRNLVDKAAATNNIEILKYLIDMGGDFSNSILECLGSGRRSQTVITYLISKGANIDQLGYWNTTALCEKLKSFIRVLVNKEQYRDNDQKRFGDSLKEYLNGKDIIEFYIELGADPNKLDNKGSTYIDIVNNSWAEHVLVKHKVMKEVESILFPNKPIKNKWKFWEN